MICKQTPKSFISLQIIYRQTPKTLRCFQTIYKQTPKTLRHPHMMCRQTSKTFKCFLTFSNDLSTNTQNFQTLCPYTQRNIHNSLNSRVRTHLSSLTFQLIKFMTQELGLILLSYKWSIMKSEKVTYVKFKLKLNRNGFNARQFNKDHDLWIMIQLLQRKNK